VGITSKGSITYASDIGALCPSIALAQRNEKEDDDEDDES
jgi:hypothetical protein